MQLMLQMEGAALAEEDPAIEEGIENDEMVEEVDADSDTDV